MRRILLFCIFFFSLAGLRAQDVYRTPSGKKYHTATCRTVKNVSEQITIEEALQSGLGPCLVCNPAPPAQRAVPKSPQGQQKQTVQCKGQTRSGTRCRHLTSIGNGYCFQHQPG